MWAYILKRLLLMIPTLLGILIITFVIVQFVPGGPVEQIASMALYLASDAAAQINGASFSIDGGWTAR